MTMNKKVTIIDSTFLPPNFSFSSPSSSSSYTLNNEKWSCSSLSPSTASSTNSKKSNKTAPSSCKNNNNNNKGFSLLPLNFTPTPYTVICGRGRNHFESIGNRRLQVICSLYSQKYAQAKLKVEKTMIVSSIVQTFQDACPIGAFVLKRVDDSSKYNGNNNNNTTTTTTRRWYEVSEIVAREKVGSVLRDCLFPQYKSSKISKKARRNHVQRNNKKQQNNSLSSCDDTSISTCLTTISNISSKEQEATVESSLVHKPSASSSSSYSSTTGVANFDDNYNKNSNMIGGKSSSGSIMEEGEDNVGESKIAVTFVSGTPNNEDGEQSPPSFVLSLSSNFSIVSEDGSSSVTAATSDESVTCSSLSNNNHEDDSDHNIALGSTKNDNQDDDLSLFVSLIINDNDDDNTSSNNKNEYDHDVKENDNETDNNSIIMNEQFDDLLKDLDIWIQQDEEENGIYNNNENKKNIRATLLPYNKQQEAKEVKNDEYIVNDDANMQVVNSSTNLATLPEIPVPPLLVTADHDMEEMIEQENDEHYYYLIDPLLCLETLQNEQ